MKKIAVLVIGLLLLSSGFVYAKKGLSDFFSLNIDPYSRKQVGEAVWKQVERFFMDAEKAIESENLEKLMALYSNRYKNGDHTRKTARQIWKRLFNKFDLVATHHNMRFITTSPSSGIMIIRCSGVLVGIPKNGRNLITIDSWTDSDHVLTKDGDKWKLIGTSGRETQRFWFDKPMQPLF